MIRLAKYLGWIEVEGAEGEDRVPSERAALLRSEGDGTFVRDEGEKPVEVANGSGVPIAIGKIVLVAPNPGHNADPSKPPWIVVTGHEY